MATIDARENSNQQLDSVRLATDGAIGTVDDITTEVDGTPRRSSDRFENHDGNTDRERSPDRSDNHDREPTGGAGSETRDETSNEILDEARDEDTTSFAPRHAVSDSLQFNGTTGTSETFTDAATEGDVRPTHTPEWTNLNGADPSVTLAEGGFLTDVDLRSNDDDRSSRREGRFSETDTDTSAHTGFATTLEDASPTLSMSWLF